MTNEIVMRPQLEKLLMSHWTEFLNKTALLRRVLEDARNTSFKVVNKHDAAPASQLKVTITKFQLLDNSKFELWVEFAVPREDGTVIGTHTYHLGLDGSLRLEESYGVLFQTERSDNL